MIRSIYWTEATGHFAEEQRCIEAAAVGSDKPAQGAEDSFDMFPGMNIAEEELSGSSEELCC